MSKQLTQNFHLHEFERSGTATRCNIDNKIPQDLLENVEDLAQFLQRIRERVNCYQSEDLKIIITSGYRSPKLNKRIGGSKNSDHMKALAADIKVPGMTTQELFNQIITSDLQYKQCINEFDEWVHVSIPVLGEENKCQNLKACKVPKFFGGMKTIYLEA